MSKQTCFNTIAMKAENVGEVMIYDTIGEDWYGEGLTAKSFDASLKALGPVTTLEIRINSGGGDVFHGNAIYTQLVAHPAKKLVFIDGIAASMASIIAMAGDEIAMSANALFMIHEPSGVAIGTAEDMLETAALLDKISVNAVGVYAARTGMDPSAVKAAMTAETWYSADEAKAAGFITSITPNKQMVAQVDVSNFTNVPAWAHERLKQFSSLSTKGQSMPETKPESEKKAEPVASVDVAEITAKANAAAHERVTQIHSKCALAGMPHLAAGFSADPTMTVADVQAKLFDAMCKANKPVGDEGSSDNGQSAADPNAKFAAEYAALPQEGKRMSLENYQSLRRFQEGLEPLIPPTK